MAKALENTLRRLGRAKGYSGDKLTQYVDRMVKGIRNAQKAARGAKETGSEEGSDGQA